MREAFRYIDALRHAWTHRRQLAPVMLLSVGSVLIAAVAQRLYANAIGASPIATLPRLLTARPLSGSTLAIAITASLALAGFSRVATLLVARLYGGFVATAYASESAETAVGLTSGSG